MAKTVAALVVSQAQGEALIRKALSELKLWGLQRTFSFVPSKDSSASTAAASAGKSAAAAGGAGVSRPVQLIKEWSEVLSELGNHQSLVASLKTSHYHHLFKVGSSFLSPSFLTGCYAS
jgi:dynein heavy chain 2